ncbi:hypothetical protein, partial [Nocardia abscessus]|uniref:hypothetical protein n=1 Tax=Nocardia abscessus TaxID=120957 RepID=UPI003CC7FFB9
MNRSRLPVVLAIVVAVIAIAVGVVVIRGANDAPVAARQLTCLGGSEKSALMADAEVRAILRDEYGVEVRFDKRGSYDLVQIPTDQLREQKIDCLWPSSASARSVFEESHRTGDFPDYRAESALETPEVIYAGAAATDALVAAGPAGGGGDGDKKSRVKSPEGVGGVRTVLYHLRCIQRRLGAVVREVAGAVRLFE